MATIGKLAVSVTARTKSFRKGLGRARGSLLSFAAGVKRVAIRAVKFGAVLTGAAAAALSLLVRREFQAIDATAKFADEVGLSIKTMMGLQHAAAITGTKHEMLKKGLQRMVRVVGESEQGYGTALNGLAALGLKAEELGKLNTEQIFLRLSDAISGIKSPTKKAAAGYAIFGRQAQELMTLLNTGSKGLRDLIEENERLEGSFGRIDASRVEAANDAIERTGVTIRGMIRHIAVGLAPFVRRVADMLTSGFIIAREKLLPILGSLTRSVIDGVVRLVKFVAPPVLAMAGIFRQAFSFIWGVAKTVWGGIAAVMTPVIQRIGALIGSTGTLRDLFVRAFIRMEWAVKNWKNLLALALLGVAHSFVRFGNQVRHLFTEMLPTAITWWVNNIFEVFADVGRMIGTFYKNLGKNTITFFKNLPKLMTGQMSFAELQKKIAGPLDGFKKSFDDLPKFAKRKISGLEKTLGDARKGLEDSLNADYGKFLETRLEQIGRQSGKLGSFLDKLVAPDLSAFEPTLKLGAGAEDTIKNFGKAATPAAVERGSVAAYSAGVQSHYRTLETTSKATAKYAQKTSGGIEESNRLLQQMTEQSATVVTF